MFTSLGAPESGMALTQGSPSERALHLHLGVRGDGPHVAGVLSPAPRRGLGLRLGGRRGGLTLRQLRLPRDPRLVVFLLLERHELVLLAAPAKPAEQRAARLAMPRGDR